MLQMFIAEIFIYIVNTCISIKITFTLLLRMGVGASADPEFVFKWKFAKSDTILFAWEEGGGHLENYHVNLTNCIFYEFEPLSLLFIDPRIGEKHNIKIIEYPMHGPRLTGSQISYKRVVD